MPGLGMVAGYRVRERQWCGYCTSGWHRMPAGATERIDAICVMDVRWKFI
jgi:hypothetical protein